MTTAPRGREPAAPRWRPILLGLCAAAALWMHSDRSWASTEERLHLSGSSTLAPLADEIGKRFAALNPGVRIDVRAGGSSRGIAAARNGPATIGMSSRELHKEEARGLVSHTIARDGVCILVHKDNPIRELSHPAIKQIYTGTIRNWKDVGGNDAPITVITRAEGSGEREIFLSHFDVKAADVKADLVGEGNEQSINALAGNPNAIVYVSVGAAEWQEAKGAPVKLLPLHGVAATTENVANGTYPVTRPLLLLTGPDPGRLAKEFIRYALSPAVHDLILKRFYAKAGIRPIIIGSSNVQSGPSAELGKNLTQGSMKYFDLVNNSGGIQGRPIFMIVRDDRYEPEPAVENTHDLVMNNHLLFLFDYVGTPTLTRVLPLLKYYADKQIVNVAPFTGADPQRQPPFDKYVFNIRASYREETRTLVDYLHAKGHRKIGMLIQADAYGKNGEVGVRAALRTHGLEPVAVVTYRRNQAFEVSMREQVDILRKEGVEAVIAIGTYGPCGAFIRDARLAGWNVPIANVSFVGPQTLLEILRAASAAAKTDLTANLINSQVVPSPYDTHYPLVRSYLAHIPKDAVGFTSLEGWLNAAVVTEALRRAGADPERSDFIRAMRSLSGWDPGLGVKLDFTGTNQGLHKVWLTKAEHGRWVPERAPGGPQ